MSVLCGVCDFSMLLFASPTSSVCYSHVIRIGIRSVANNMRIRTCVFPLYQAFLLRGGRPSNPPSTFVVLGYPCSIVRSLRVSNRGVTAAPRFEDTLVDHLFSYVVVVPGYGEPSAPVHGTLRHDGPVAGDLHRYVTRVGLQRSTHTPAWFELMRGEYSPAPPWSQVRVPQG